MVSQIIDQNTINVCLFDSGVLSLFIIVKTPMTWFVVKFKWVKMSRIYNKNILWSNIPLLLGFLLFNTVISSTNHLLIKICILLAFCSITFKYYLVSSVCLNSIFTSKPWTVIGLRSMFFKFGNVVMTHSWLVHSRTETI